MSKRNKYSLIGKRLSDSGLERVRLTFEELNDLCSLPSTAYRDRTFWANTWRSFRAQGWLEVGYVVDEVSLGNYVEFHHDPKRAQNPGAGRKNSSPKQLETVKRSSYVSKGNVFLPLTAENIENIHSLALESKQYGRSFAMIHDILHRFPKNTDRELVAMKISLIDVTNSTNLGKYAQEITLSELTDLILSIQDFDLRISQGDPDLVSQLAKSNGKKNLFSFASKYCTYHNVDIYGRDDYSIFDGVVRKALPHYVRGLKESTLETWRKTYNYTAFEKCIGDLLDQSGITIPFRRRKFDHFLWYANRKK